VQILQTQPFAIRSALLQQLHSNLGLALTHSHLPVNNRINHALTNTYQQDHQALLKAKYCPWVAAASCAQKHKKTIM